MPSTPSGSGPLILERKRETRQKEDGDKERRERYMEREVLGQKDRKRRCRKVEKAETGICWQMYLKSTKRGRGRGREMAGEREINKN